MNPRVMALLLPVTCVLIAVVMALAIPFAVMAMVVMFIRPEFVTMIQSRTERKIVRQIFSHATRKTMATP